MLVQKYYYQEEDPRLYDGCTDVKFVVQFDKFFSGKEIQALKDAAKRAFPDEDPNDFPIRVEGKQLIMYHYVEGGVGNIQHFAEDGYEKAKRSPYNWI